MEGVLLLLGPSNSSVLLSSHLLRNPEHGDATLPCGCYRFVWIPEI